MRICPYHLPLAIIVAILIKLQSLTRSTRLDRWDGATSSPRQIHSETDWRRNREIRRQSLEAAVAIDACLRLPADRTRGSNWPNHEKASRCLGRAEEGRAGRHHRTDTQRSPRRNWRSSSNPCERTMVEDVNTTHRPNLSVSGLRGQP